MIKAVGKHINRLTKKAYETHGFAYAEILTQWKSIVGAELAEICTPVSIRWPRGFSEKTTGRQKLGGTLIISTAGPCAIELQHESPRIIERINTFYGYGAITALKIIQGHHIQPPSSQIPKSGKLSPERETQLSQELEGVDDERLKEALQKLGRGALRRNSAR
ncbi:MAG: DUF721 domain-containing protein [Hyphomicrobiales bacterium]